MDTTEGATGEGPKESTPPLHAGTVDAGTVDAGPVDAGPVDAGIGRASTPHLDVLFTGFTPFREHARNPSWEVARAAAAELGEGAEARLLDVRYDVVAALPAEQPSARLVVGVGLRAVDAALHVECVARNVGGAEPDNAGSAIAGPLVDGEAAELHADAELVGALVAELDEACEEGAVRSTDAGTYVCNAWLHAQLRAGTPAVFVHVPFVSSDRAEAIGRSLGRAVRSVLAARG